MSVTDDIIAARRFGFVRCGLSAHPEPTVSEIARQFGLRDDASCFREVDAGSARGSVLRMLHRDLAYDREIMPLAQAGQFADRFFDQFGPGARYFTSSEYPLTSATFEEGVLVLAPHRSGCLWVEDED